MNGPYICRGNTVKKEKQHYLNENIREQGQNVVEGIIQLTL